MTVQRTGIPTTFQHQNFRSRLEARWAAFFDLIEWPWIYEPYDLEGYIPDFLVTGKAPFLVEVKPAVSLEELKKTTTDLQQRKIGEQLYDEETGRSTDLVIVGVAPIIKEKSSSHWLPVFGVSFSSFAGPNDPAVWNSTEPFAWIEDDGWFLQRPLGGHIEDIGYVRRTPDPNLIEQLWREAGNRVQWHKR